MKYEYDINISFHTTTFFYTISFHTFVLFGKPAGDKCHLTYNSGCSIISRRPFSMPQIVGGLITYLKEEEQRVVSSWTKSRKQ